MLLLTKSKVSETLYNVAMIDAPGNGSIDSMYQNIIESCSILNPFEMAYKNIEKTFKAYGYNIYDYQDFENKVKPFYQYLRHGLSFDWVLNYIVGNINKVFPFCTFQKFKGTLPFINKNKEDPIFYKEISNLNKEFEKLLNSLFLSLDKTVFTRFSNDASSINFVDCVKWAKLNKKEDDYYISEELIYNMNYLVALGLMLEKSVGIFKRGAWHDAYTKIENEELPSVLICGGKFRAFAFGKIFDNEKPKWHYFESGIQMMVGSCRSQRSDITRVFPDEMTFFNFGQKSIFIDESYFPEVSFDSGKNWYNAITFTDVKELQMDKPLKLMIRYKFEQDPKNPRIIKIKAKQNCAVKDCELTLDSNGVAETQLIFRGDSVGFKISETTKEYPFAVFNNSKLKIKDFEWL